MNIHNCIIIGSGPAGYSASIYAARSNLNPIIISGPNPGGQLTTTTKVENYLGFPYGIYGNDFMENCKKQAKRFDVEILNESVSDVIFRKNIGEIHKVFLGKKDKFLYGRGIIIATGSYPKFLGIKKEKDLLGYGISFCATCDGFFYKNKIVAIVGGGDTALEEAIYLSKICKKIYLLVRKNYFKASKILQNYVLNKKNINILFCSTVVKIKGNNFLEGIEIYDKKRKRYHYKNINGLFIAIGNNPNTKIFEKKIKLDKNGYILTDKNCTSTSTPGVFAAGDVQDYKYRQAITSAGTGCMAALDLEKYLYSISAINN